MFALNLLYEWYIQFYHTDLPQAFSVLSIFVLSGKKGSYCEDLH